MLIKWQFSSSYARAAIHRSPVADSRRYSPGRWAPVECPCTLCCTADSPRLPPRAAGRYWSSINRQSIKPWGSTHGRRLLHGERDCERVQRRAGCDQSTSLKTENWESNTCITTPTNHSTTQTNIPPPSWTLPWALPPGSGRSDGLRNFLFGSCSFWYMSLRNRHPDTSFSSPSSPRGWNISMVSAGKIDWLIVYQSKSMNNSRAIMHISLTISCFCDRFAALCTHCITPRIPKFNQNQSIDNQSKRTVLFIIVDNHPSIWHSNKKLIDFLVPVQFDWRLKFKNL